MRSIKLAESNTVSMRERYLVRKVMRAFELMLQDVYFAEIKASKHRKRQLLTAFRQFVFFRRRERSILQLQRQSRERKTKMNTFKLWRTLRIDLGIANKFQATYLMKRAYYGLIIGTKQLVKERQLSNACHSHYQARLMRTALTAWQQTTAANY